MTGLRLSMGGAHHEGGAVSSNRMHDFTKWPPDVWAAKTKQLAPIVTAHATDVDEAAMFMAMLMEVD